MSAANSNLNSKEVLELEKQVLTLIANVDSKKYKMHNNDFRQLTNHLQYCLTTIRNISQTMAVEQSDPYNSYMKDYTRVSNLEGKKVQYLPNGSVRIVSASSLNTTGDAWENQFDESMLIRPPCFQAPPQNLTNITTIRQANEWNRVKHANSADPTGVQRL